MTKTERLTDVGELMLSAYDCPSIPMYIKAKVHVLYIEIWKIIIPDLFVIEGIK